MKATECPVGLPAYRLPMRLAGPSFPHQSQCANSSFASSPLAGFRAGTRTEYSVLRTKYCYTHIYEYVPTSVHR